MGIFAAGCVGAPPPHEELASSEAASNGPQAGVYLELAQKELEQGKTLMREGKNREAAVMLERAQVDAEVASAFARESRTRMAAQQAKARAQALRADFPSSAIGGGPLQSPNPTEPGPTPIQPSGPISPPAQAPAQPHP
jgi:hypothetical protein